MKKNIIISIVFILTVLFVIAFVSTNNKNNIDIKKTNSIASNQKTPNSKDNIKKLILTDKVTKLGMPKNNSKTKSVATLNNEIDNFLKQMSNQDLPPIEKQKLIDVIRVNEPSFWGKHKELYNLIATEKNKYIRNDLIAEFFSLYARPYNGELPNPTPEQRAEISNLVKELIKNPLTRDRSLARTNILLNNDEVQNMYQELKHQLNKEEQQGLLDSYIDGMILDGKNPTSEGFSEVEKYLPKEDIKKRTQNLLGFMSKFTEGQDTSSWDNDFIRKQLESPTANAQPGRYIEWMRARASMLQGYQAKAQFINSEFHKISQPYKHEFILRMPAYTPMVENLYTYLLDREQQLLQILTNVIRIDDPKVFKALTEFRAIFLFSKDNNLRQSIDRIVKQLIDILPDYQVSLDILKFIKDEQVYIPSSSLNIDSQIQRISNNITTKKNENDLDTGKIPDDNPL